MELDFAKIFREAHVAGQLAAQACVPTPMAVVERANPLDDKSPIIRRYPVVQAGVCGFAWVTIFPGNCKAANYAKKNLGWRKPYGGGMQLWVSQYNQSMEMKYAYASAYAGVLQKYGITAYPGSRMD